MAAHDDPKTLGRARLSFAKEAVRLRRLDEAAKDPNAETAPVTHFMRYVDELLRGE